MRPRPLLAACEMGYGHIRAARPLASVLGVPAELADRPPLCSPGEQKVWDFVRDLHRWSSQGSELPIVGRPVRAMLDAATTIPALHPYRDLARPSLSTRLLDLLAARGFGGRLVERLRSERVPLLTTFFAPAVVADRAGLEHVFCVVTDADINRVWAPLDPRRSRIRYLAPSGRVVRRLRSFGVPEALVSLTGFPLPHELVGGEDLVALRRNLGPRLVRLDPKRRFREQCHHDLAHFFAELGHAHEGEPPLLTFAVGGAGAQSGLIDAALPGMREQLAGGRIRLALVAGTNPEVAERFRRAIHRVELGDLVGDGIEILHEPDLEAYFGRFDELLGRTDILWTKPSELTFYGALGLPLVLCSPVGVHERFNLRYAREQGVGVKQRNPAHVGTRIDEWLDDGTLAAAAWSGFMRLPKLGTYRVAEQVCGEKVDR